jgi:hypothetical protein
VVSLPTIEQTPRKSREPTPNLRGARPSPATVVPIRRALEATRVSETEIADTVSNQSAIALPVKPRAPFLIAVGVIVVLAVAAAAFFMTRREAEPPAAEVAPAPAPRATPAAPEVTPPSPATADVTPEAPAAPAVNDARPRRTPPRAETVITAPPPAMQEPAPTEMRPGRAVLEVDQF